jgi:hypothetical protein
MIKAIKLPVYDVKLQQKLLHDLCFAKVFSKLVLDEFLKNQKKKRSKINIII